MDSQLIKHLHGVGQAQLRIKELLARDIFDTLSKHNPYWDSEHEAEGEKLEDARCALNGIQCELWEIQEALSAPEDDK